MNNNYLKRITLKPEDLLLDPNNPRLVHDISNHDKVADIDILSRQDGIKLQFAKSGSTESDEFTDISDLYDSMIRIGYVAIDRIVVRHIVPLDKYVVIEGNRRVSTIKMIRERAANNDLSDRGENSERTQYEAVKNSFEQLEVLELKTKGLTEEEVNKRIDIILGLRHFGSVLDWKPLNRAFNVYKNYMAIEPPLKAFKLDPPRLKEVASRLAVSKSEVKKALETYIVFMQLCILTSDIREDNYSLIEHALPLRTYDYFNQDGTSFELDAESLEKLLELCQFDKRNSGVDSKAIIIPEPKKFGVLRKILKVSVDFNQQSAIRSQAAALAEEVRVGELEETGPNAGHLTMPVDKAYSLLKAEMIRRDWVPTLQKKLDKQENELPVDQYEGEGNEKINKLALENSIRNLRVIFGL